MNAKKDVDSLLEVVREESTAFAEGDVMEVTSDTRAVGAGVVSRLPSDIHLLWVVAHDLRSVVYTSDHNAPSDLGDIDRRESKEVRRWVKEGERGLVYIHVAALYYPVAV